MRYTHITNIPYTIRNMMNRWKELGKIAMTHDEVLPTCAKLAIGLKTIKPNGRIVFIQLQLAIKEEEFDEEERVEKFQGNEREANAWLSEMYDKYSLVPSERENNYWNEYLPHMRQALGIGVFAQHKGE